MNREEAEDRGYSPDEMYDDAPVERALAFGDLTQKEQSVYQCDLAKAHEWLEGLLDESDPLILVTKMVGTADGQTVTVPAGALRHPSSYPSSIRVTVEGVEHDIFDDVVAYIKAKLMERQP